MSLDKNNKKAQKKAVKAKSAKKKSSNPNLSQASNASNFNNALGAEVSPRTGDLSLSLNVPTVYGFLGENITPSIKYSQSSLDSGNQMLGLPLGWQFPFSYIYEERVFINGDQSFFIDSSYSSGMRYYTLEDANFEFTSIAFPYDTSQQTANILRFLNGNTQYFDKNGRLIGIDDRFGNYVMFHYNTTSGGVFSSKLLSITTGYGQEIIFDYGQDAITISYPDSDNNSIDFSYLVANQSSELIGYKDPLGNKTTIINNGGSENRLVSELIYFNGLKILYEYSAIKLKLSSTDFTLKDVVSCVKEQHLEDSREFTYNYNPLDNEHNYTGFPNYIPSSFEDTLLLNGSDYAYTTQIHDGILITEHCYNHLHLELERNIYTLDKELIKQVANNFQGQDKDGFFPAYDDLIAKFPNYQTPTEEHTKVYNDSGEYRHYLTKTSIDVFANLIAVDSYESKLNQEAVELASSARMTYDYDDPRYKDTPSYGLLVQSYTADYGIWDKTANTAPVVRGQLSALSQDHKNIASMTTGFADKVDAEALSSLEKKISYQYDDKGRITNQKVAWVDGKTHDLASTEEAISYNLSDGILTVANTNTQGDTSTQEIDITTGWLIKTSNALGYGVSHSYDNMGNILKSEYPLDGIIEWEYDYANNKVTKIFANGYKLHNYSNGFGQLLQESDNNGSGDTDRVLSQKSYNQVGQLVYEEGILGAQSRVAYQYNSRGELSLTTDILGNEKNVIQDSVSQTEQTNYNGHHASSIGFNDHHKMITTSVFSATSSQTVSGGATYNIHDKMTAAVLGDIASQEEHWAETELGYNFELSVVKRSHAGFDQIRATKETERDLFNNAVLEKIKVVQSGQEAEEAVGDQFIFNDLNQLTKEINPLGQARSFTYDSVGRIATSTDYAGTVFSYSYFENDLIKSYSFKDKDNKIHQKNWTYNPLTFRIATLEELIDGVSQGLMTYDYTLDGNLALVKYPDGKQISYTYNATNMLIGLSDAFNKETHFEYDSFGRINNVAVDEKYHTAVTYLSKEDSPINSGQIKSIATSNGVTLFYEYTGLGMVAKEVTLDNNLAEDKNILLCCEYVYDPTTQNIIKLIRSSTAFPSDRRVNITTEYSYSSLNQVLCEKTTDAKANQLSKIEYAYDAANNVSVKTERDKQNNQRISQYRYDKDNKLVEEVTLSESITFSYDANGNLIANSKGHSYGYDLENRLVSYTDSSAELNASYAYYPNGLRKSKTIQGQSPIVFYYDERVKNATIINESQDMQHSSYLMFAGKRFLRLLHTESSQEVESQQLISNYKDMMATYKDNKLKDIYNYRAYGGTKEIPADVVQKNKKKKEEALTILANPFQYSMEYLDVESGLIYLRARYYNPSIKRFMTRDTAPLLNRYAYANGNPIMFTDPSGHFAIVAGVGLFAALSAFGPIGWAIAVAITIIVVVLVVVFVIIPAMKKSPKSTTPNRTPTFQSTAPQDMARNALQSARQDARFRGGVDPGTLYLGGGTTSQRRALFNAYPELLNFGYMRAGFNDLGLGSHEIGFFEGFVNFVFSWLLYSFIVFLLPTVVASRLVPEPFEPNDDLNDNDSDSDNDPPSGILYYYREAGDLVAEEGMGGILHGFIMPAWGIFFIIFGFLKALYWYS